MSKVIIGIHGLANKPPRKTLTEYWQKSIDEGLRVNCKIQKPKFNFKMVYWANRLYKTPMHEDPNYTFDKLYNSQPYLKAKKLRAYTDSFRDDLRNVVGRTVGTGFDWFKQQFGVERIADAVLGEKLKDLDFYYDPSKKVQTAKGGMDVAQKVLRDELTQALKTNKQNEIMLIAHSMGTIIAYDVLRKLGNDDPQGWNIPHFVTIGSPLGLPHVKMKTINERKAEKRPKAAKIRTPSLVSKTWVNYADRKDKVALDSHLKDDYGPNDLGVRVRDDLVSNDYIDKNGEANHHKSYGYLRTPEISKHIKAFLDM